MNQQNLETIKKTVEDFFQKTTFEVEVDLLPEFEERRSSLASSEDSAKEETIHINLKTDEPQILIGEGGQTLNEIQHLFKAILKRKISEPFYINLDINDYKKKKTEYLKELARSLADEVSLTKKEKTLAPMPAYERRIIHLELSSRSDVVSESAGEEPDRKIVIRPSS